MFWGCAEMQSETFLFLLSAPCSILRALVLFAPVIDQGWFHFAELGKKWIEEGGACVPHRMAGSSDSTDRSIEALDRMKQGSGRDDNMAHILPVFRFELLLLIQRDSQTATPGILNFLKSHHQFLAQSHGGIKWVRKREVRGDRGRSRCESNMNRAGILINIMYVQQQSKVNGMRMCVATKHVGMFLQGRNSAKSALTTWPRWLLVFCGLPSGEESPLSSSSPTGFLPRNLATASRGRHP
ncbi:hypothetical protein F5144DRAFT_191216 [Chaetomium tenue]|uniref:Uncharacterized protein n=1 Tax=Chaetomium tenue TaxID=1854479 RepID=A0ACB7PEH3_9PEZI|nr:hypothetical protein F5144DRAFT_191216 [Chaetomium globosum]